MSLQIKNTSELISPGNLRLTVLVYGLSGTGKTSFCATAPDVGIATCETGHGKGLLSIATKGLEYVEPSTLADFEAIVNGKVFANKSTLALDSLSEMVRTFIKDAALQIPRAKGESDKRRRGIPELDDYGTMGEITRKLIRALTTQNPTKHIVVTALEKYDRADPENGQAETLIGPDLPGAMFLACPAMFDLVLRLRTRQVLKDPRDAKSRVVQRYFLTQPDGLGSIVKNRNNIDGVPLLDKEEIFDPTTGQGTFTYLLDKLQRGYAAMKEQQVTV